MESKRLLIFFSPGFPQPGKGERLFVGQHDKQRLLLAFGSFPFIKAVGNDQAAAFLKGVFERGLFSNGLCPGIDHAIADGGMER